MSNKLKGAWWSSPGTSPPSHRSRSRLSTRDSNYNSSYRVGSRSESPSEYYRYTQIQRDTLHDRMHELNVFIHKGIEKFLDKQSVRELIIEYDNDDIYVGGEQLFMEQINNELGGEELLYRNSTTSVVINFSESAEKRTLNGQNLMMSMNMNNSNNTIFQIRGSKQAQAKKPQQFSLLHSSNNNNNNQNISIYAEAIKRQLINQKAKNNQKSTKSQLNLQNSKNGFNNKQFDKQQYQQQQMWTKPRPSLWNTFFSMIRIKIFNIRYQSGITSRIQRRRRVDNNDNNNDNNNDQLFINNYP